jgi:hypothetical protein
LIIINHSKNWGKKYTKGSLEWRVYGSDISGKCKP